MHLSCRTMSYFSRVCGWLQVCSFAMLGTQKAVNAETMMFFKLFFSNFFGFLIGGWGGAPNAKICTRSKLRRMDVMNEKIRDVVWHQREPQSSEAHYLFSANLCWISLKFFFFRSPILSSPFPSH